MGKVLLKPLTIALFFILLSSDAYAVNLGSVIKNRYAEITAYESAKMTMLFWNAEEESYVVKLSVKESPKDWTILLDPNEFVLNKSIGEEFIALPYSKENIKAKIVNLFVKPDKNSKVGKYSIIVGAETLLPQDEGNIVIIPERLFTFEVNLSVGLEEVRSNDTIKFFGVGLDRQNENPKMIVSSEVQETEKYFFVFVMLLALLTLIIIYKKS